MINRYLVYKHFTGKDDTHFVVFIAPVAYYMDNFFCIKIKLSFNCLLIRVLNTQPKHSIV